MSQYVFGTGQLYATNVGGGAPLRFGALQDVSVDFNGDIKTLFGQYQFPLDAARGKTKIEWKAASGNVDVSSYNTLFFGGTVDEGDELVQAFNEPQSIPAMSTYTVTATHGADFYLDLGVNSATTGEPFTQVLASPGENEYTVSNVGVYTFNAMNASDAILLNYMWENASAGGSLEVTNQLMGSTPKFQLVLSQLYEAQTFTLILYSAVAEKLSLPLKQDDYLIADMSGQCFADAANRVARITTTSTSGGGN